MKKLIIFILCMFSTIIAQDFRNSTWGETIQQVKKKEKSKLVIDDTKNNEMRALIYEDRIYGFDSYLWYMFNHENKLCFGAYWFRVKHTTEDLYFDDYEKIKKNISIKYGVGKTESELSNELLKDNLGMALSLGLYKINTVWETDNTKIVLMLNSDNFEIKLTLGYVSTTVINEEKSHF